MDHGLRRASLVSLESAVSYWLRQGYHPVAEQGERLAAELADKLAGYGPQARYMARAIPL
jgi:hypothetical protein